MLTSMKRTTYLAGLSVSILGIVVVLQIHTFPLTSFSVVKDVGSEAADEGTPTSHTFIRSLSTADGRYFPIDVGGELAMNPNIIPHPNLESTWVLVAQLRQDPQNFAELVCNARFDNGVMRCIDSPSKLPIAPTTGDKCTGDLAYFALSQGPHDARVFYGPNQPYTIYGSNSQYTCFGQWVHDFRNLMDWGYEADAFPSQFASATELQRPPPWGSIEKNWFLFWDLDGHTYAHYDVFPSRVFARIDDAGSTGESMVLTTSLQDEACMAQYMPKLGPELESIHQATNSLSITMCKRRDLGCTPDESNTFIFTIFQHKKYFNFHAVYEPYVLLFEQALPFKIHAISKKPFWILGRNARVQSLPTGNTPDMMSDMSLDLEAGEEMLYVTSMSWSDGRQRYHGYIDDVLIIAFGIEDQTTAAIDIMAGDLMQDLGTC